MEEKKCKDCGSDDIFVSINYTNNNTTEYQCQDCFDEDREKIVNKLHDV